MYIVSGVSTTDFTLTLPRLEPSCFSSTIFGSLIRASRYFGFSTAKRARRSCSCPRVIVRDSAIVVTPCCDALGVAVVVYWLPVRVMRTWLVLEQPSYHLFSCRFPGKTRSFRAPFGLGLQTLEPGRQRARGRSPTARLEMADGPFQPSAIEACARGVAWRNAIRPR